VAALPQRLSQALASNVSEGQMPADALAYTPAFELWSDGAEKRRWVRLPIGAVIDTSDMDSWGFPVGTELWKEFSQNGRRLETRLLTRVAADSDGWVGVAYRWNKEQTDAFAVPEGEDDVLESSHDVPEARACMTCHGGREHRVLGFSALQLSHAPKSDAEWTLERLTREGRLSAAPSAPIQVPGTATEAAALGYLHANCGSCHNADRPRSAVYYQPPAGLDLWLRVSQLSSAAATPTYRSTLGQFIVPGKPEESQLYRRFAGLVWLWPTMPPIGSEVTDPNGLKLIERWIRELGEPRSVAAR
jgi:mono/diheme cytochrome c family protein